MQAEASFLDLWMEHCTLYEMVSVVCLCWPQEEERDLSEKKLGDVIFLEILAS